MVKRTISEARADARIDPVLVDDRFDHLAIRLHAGRVRAEVIADLTGRAARGFVGWLAGLGRRLVENWRRRATLAELARLDDRILRDIGLTRDQLGVAAARAASVGWNR